MTTGPLDGVRVIEAGQLLAGPFAGQLMGDMGADVIKVEPPGVGDPMRQWGREKAEGSSLWWPVVGRNKRSVTLNLREAAGQEILIELIRTADIFVENFRPGTLEKWNLGYDRLREINPRLVLVRVSGYGQTGPYSSRAGYGSIGEAMGGLRYITGDPDRQPSRTGISIGDALAAMHATIGALAALRHRDVTGEGQVVDSAIYESVLAMMESMVTEWDVQGYQRERTGAVLPNVAPSNVYPTADGQLILIAANQDSVFGRLVALMNEPELAEPGSRYGDHSGRGEHQQELDDYIGLWTSKYDADALLALLHEGGVPAGRIFKAADMLTDPHFIARDAIVRVSDPKFGELAMQNVVPKLSATPGSVRWTGPELGQHNDEVYGDLLGLDEARRAELLSAGVIYMEREDDYASVGFRGRIGWGSRPAVVVVDVVTAYLEGGPLTDGGGRFESARASTARVVEAARAAGHPVVFTTVKLAAGGADAGWFAVKVPGLSVFEDGSPYAVFPDAPAPRPGEVVVTKQYASSFFGTSLAATLTATGIDTVVVTGFSTSGCVRATALDALQHGFRPIVVADACGDRDAATHDQNLFDLDSKYADVLSEAEVVAHLTSGATS